MIDIINIKNKDFSEPIIIDSQEVYPGEVKLVKLNVGKLPSDTRIHITAHVIRSKTPGPTGLILGGVHGDEINGIEIVRSIKESDGISNLKCGNLILIPLLNVYGFINFSREVPDGKDVNRSFPGSLQGSLAARVARILSKKILPHVDFAIDCHTGGASKYNYPQIRYTIKDEISERLALAFAAPFTIQKGMIPKSFRKICKERGIPIIVYEGGESIRLDGYAIEKAINGIKRTIKALGMIDSYVPEAPSGQVKVIRTTWIRAPHSGIFIWSRKSGALIKRNEPLGEIKDPFGNKSVTIFSNKSGYIIGHNNASVVNHGDAIFHLAYNYEKIN